MNKEYFNVNSPLKIIALMIGLCEIGFGILSTTNTTQTIIIWAMIGLPFIVVLLFFLILFKKPNNLYAPADFEDQKDFLTLRSKIDDIEKNSFIRYSNLEEPAIRLFLSAYYGLKNTNSEKTKQEQWDYLIKEFGAEELSKALNQLVKYEWLSVQEQPFALTKEGEKAHKVLKQFVYGRLG